MAARAITLNSGYKMPVIGLGVWRMEGRSIRDLLLSAIKIGYRHFDCVGLLSLPSPISSHCHLNCNYLFS
ncbi:NADP-dependent D-sorbitol-6-phosphate dehydrogenase [Platanthera zijinensis]|uniref:NADP-dependent D-sorbitol-6-phosphate dehydrogenase n=1 Tax=Platanthera zijinensis TaxID=2320716 RepID=A0AAP0G903_9ASPA